MTLNDFREKITTSKDPDWFNTQQEIFGFKYVNSNTTLTGVSAIYEFVLQQISGWEKYGTDLPSELLNSKKYFENIRNLITTFINSQSNNTSAQLRTYWAPIKNQINNIATFPLRYDLPETEFLIKVFQDHKSSFSSAFSFIVGKTYITNDKNSLIGVLLAYEFTLKDTSEITERRNVEKSSISKIRTDFQKYLSESEIQLTTHLINANKKYSDYANALDVLTKAKEDTFNEWFQRAKSSFSLFDETSKNKIADLETTYEELLRLKKPAEYWNLRAAELKREGKTFMYWLIALVALACITLYSLLWLTPEGMLKTFFNEDKSVALRWSIIFITFISFLFFGIRALTKITFSSFHLARDAEERERLTFVYLALIKDASVDKDDRALIMQSLFSRADTGLLKDDSSPTMPGAGGIIEKVIQK